MIAALTARSMCPVELARYSLRGDPTVTASFRAVDSGPDWPSHLALRIHVPRTQDDSWWLPWNGGTDGRQNLASTTDVTAPGWHPPSPDGESRPIGDIEYIGTDDSFTIADSVPRRGDRAPAHFLLPHLGEVMWYHGQSAYADRLAKQFFDLAGCATIRGRRRYSSTSRDQPAGPSTSIGR